MPAKRTAITLKQEENSYVVRFRHPLSRKMMRVRLGRFPEEAQLAQGKLEALNRVFLDVAQWHNPQGLTEELADTWRAASAEEPRKPITTAGVELDSSKAAELVREVTREANAAVQRQLSIAKQEANKFKKMYEALAGRKARTEDQQKTLHDALTFWLGAYKGRDVEHTKIVRYDLWRFVDEFDAPAAGEEHGGKKLRLSDLDDCERKLDGWLRSLTKKQQKGDTTPAKHISPGRRAQIRRHVLRFLEDSGLMLVRRDVKTVGKKEIRKARGPVRYCELAQANAMWKYLPQPWRDCFEIQTQIGLRPSELPTLKISDFSPDFTKLTLSPLGEFTLKTGSRVITLANFPALLPTIKRMAEAAANVEHGALITNNGKLWDENWFYKSYNAALNDAKDKITGELAIGFNVDCRIGRRTCASLLIRDHVSKNGRILRRGRSIEYVAALLGDDPATIREHYGHLQSHEA